ncbi:MAG TPA: hypothetical protein VIN61_14740 [Gammaproteobacteria bacterium]
MHRTAVIALCGLLAFAASACSLLPSRGGVRVDSRTDFPGARPFEASRDELPGTLPDRTNDVTGAWFFRERLADAQLEVGREPWLYYSLWLWLRQDGTYDLVYQASWGSRAREAPGFGGIDVREAGRFKIGAGGVLLVEPETTRATEIRAGNRSARTLSNEDREYLVRVDRGYLNVAGRCATYQVEPICRESRDVRVSLRSISVRSPEEVPEL